MTTAIVGEGCGQPLDDVSGSPGKQGHLQIGKTTTHKASQICEVQECRRVSLKQQLGASNRRRANRTGLACLIVIPSNRTLPGQPFTILGSQALGSFRY